MRAVASSWKPALVSALLALALRATVTLAEAGALPTDTRIVLDRGACEHRCAVYTLTISSDGTVLYDGRYYVARVGKVRSHVSVADLQRLLADAATIGFFDLKDRYGYDGDLSDCDSIDSDGPAAIVTLTVGGRSKTIMHNHRCAGAIPDLLTRFEDEIDSAVNTVQWLR